MTKLLGAVAVAAVALAAPVFAEEAVHTPLFDSGVHAVASAEAKHETRTQGGSYTTGSAPLQKVSGRTTASSN